MATWRRPMSGRRDPRGCAEIRIQAGQESRFADVMNRKPAGTAAAAANYRCPQGMTAQDISFVEIVETNFGQQLDGRN